MSKEFIVSAQEEGQRLDAWLGRQTELGLSRSYAARLIKEGAVTLGGQPAKASTRLKVGDCLCLSLPEPKALELTPEALPLEYVYEDEDILIINKPKDMVVHPAAGHSSGTVVNAVLHHCQGQLSSINGELRPGIVHRIDKDTTGLLVVCKNDQAHRALAQQLKQHSITREYVALVHGRLKTEEGTVDAPLGRSRADRKKQAIDYIGGRDAVTHYRVLERLGQFSLLSCTLDTGRTHQIRVHMASIGHPLLGDEVYGPKKAPFKLQGQCLHARRLGFIHPRTGQYIEFSAEPPAYFSELVEKLRRMA